MERKKTFMKYIDATGLKPKRKSTQPEVLLLVCFLRPSSGWQRADSVLNNVSEALKKLGFIVNRA